MSVIWNKSTTEIDDAVMTFMAGEDVELDREIFGFDIAATAAHVRGLGRIGLLPQLEVTQVCDGLDALARAFRAGEFVLDQRYEDGHSAIESYLTESLGEVGKRIHLGRSRNDQVQVALRLYMKERLRDLAAGARACGLACLARARRDERTPMPGYTHLQRAVPSTVGLWMAAFAEAFADDRALAASVGKWIDRSPLGTAAGYGVNLPLDREGVARELGFSGVQWNPMYAQNARGKFELATLAALEQTLLDVRRLAWDLSLFATAEFAMVRFPARFTTGSSIMPNKNNPDVVELLRASYAPVAGAMAEIRAILSLPSGYQRDLQGTKGPLVRALKRGLDALAITAPLVEGFEIDPGAMRQAISRETFATDRATQLAADGLPFRDAYRQVADELSTLAIDPETSVSQRVSPGATADLRLDEIEERLRAE